MNNKGSEGFRSALNAEIVHGALCYDGTALEGKEIFRQELLSMGDGRYTNPNGDVYERAIPRDSDSEDHYVLLEKKRVPEPARAGVPFQKKSQPKNEWLDPMMR